MELRAVGLVVAACAACWGGRGEDWPPSAFPVLRHANTVGVRTININPAIVAGLLRSYATAQHDGLEDALCLYGGVSPTGDTLHVLYAFAPTATIERGPRHISYVCALTRDYVGTWHTHLAHPPDQPVPMRVPSGDDYIGFHLRPRAVLMLVAVGYEERARMLGLLVVYVLRDGRWGYTWMPLVEG